MTTMTLTIERTPRTLSIGGNAVDVEELDIRLPFTRKPACIDEVGGHGGHRIYITETRELTPAEFDTFARSLLMSRDWLAGKGGGTGDGHLCVEVTAPGRPYLYVNPEGSDYARYVARLGCTERSKNVRFPLGFQSKQRVHTEEPPSSIDLYGYIPWRGRIDSGLFWDCPGRILFLLLQ